MMKTDFYQVLSTPGKEMPMIMESLLNIDTAYSQGDRYSQLQDSSSESQSYGNTEEEDTAYSHGDCYSQLQDSSIESQSYGLTKEELIQELSHQKEDCSFVFASPPITSVSQTYSNLEEMASTTYYNTQGSTTVDGIRSEEPSFSGSFSDNKHYMIPKVKDQAAMTQRLQSRRDERIPEHWETLLRLKNVNIGLNCAIYSKSPYRIMEIVSPNTPFGNLKDYVLDGRCHSYVMIKILSQLASAQTYLHENQIVHGDFRSEHVNVLGPCQVQVVCLGHSKYLKAGEVNSRSGKVQDTMPADAIRWSAFEVITEGIYSYASDVWAFGVVLWELYAALAFRRNRSTLARPYYELEDDQILGHIQKGRRLYQPPGCPGWMYNIMELCWSKKRQNRPPSEVLHNCFVSRNPMQSWNLWLDQHEKRVIVVLQI